MKRMLQWGLERGRARARCALAVCFGVLFFACDVVKAKPVEFVFSVPRAEGNPFTREIWAEVGAPDGSVARLPAFYAGGDSFAVRARGDQAGVYALGKVIEGGRVLNAAAVSAERVKNPEENVARYRAMTQVGIDRRNPRRFAFADGRAYWPVGGNLAWPGAGAGQPGAEWYREVFAKFAAEKLNWSRVWMAHWAMQNLDWLPEGAGRSVEAGTLDKRVAENWDGIIDAAEARGVYVQVVLQHHGQYSTGTNSNWAGNPWNAANRGGFLKTPAEFFSSDVARRLTRAKYRYVVARWGYSPAVLAWELFNEVHWVDAMKSAEGRAAVVAWHEEMARAIRGFDVFGHLITSSCDDPRVDLGGAVDYFQPHLYALDLINAVRVFDHPAEAFRKPVFYGETGDDHVSDKNTETILPQIWASLFAEGDGLPAQTWYTDRLINGDSLSELGAVARFVERSRMAERATVAFAPRVVAAGGGDGQTMPLVVWPALNWHRQGGPVVRVALDGSGDASLGRVPGILVGSPESVADGFPQRVVFQVDAPVSMGAKLKIADAGAGGAALRVTLDEDAGTGEREVLMEHTWESNDGGKRARPAEFSVTLPAGRHTLTVANTGGKDWLRFGSLWLDWKAPVLAALGRKSESGDFAMLWVWNRKGVFARDATDAGAAGFGAKGVVVVDGLAEGKWRVSWFDTKTGREIAEARDVVMSDGRSCRVNTPAVARDVAGILEPE